MKIVIIDYNAGNVCSVIFALERLGLQPILTSDRNEILSADKVIFPGVGEAATTMGYLKEQGFDKLLPELKMPFLGICLGMQLMCAYSEEGNVNCLNIFPEKVKRFNPENPLKSKVPHMGWNTINDVKNPLFDKSIEGKYVYFVHSYYVDIGQHTVATTNYIKPFSAALHKDNFYAAQFHPEKSGDVGFEILKNFINL